MSERFKIRVLAGEGNVFAQGALDEQIGKTITVHREHGDVEGIVAAAAIVEDGAAADVTVDVARWDASATAGAGL